MRTRKVLVNGKEKEVVDWRGFFGRRTPDEIEKEPECKRIEIKPKATKEKPTKIKTTGDSSCTLMCWIKNQGG